MAKAVYGFEELISLAPRRAQGPGAVGDVPNR
jgi:hypothetical protein